MPIKRKIIIITFSIFIALGFLFIHFLAPRVLTQKRDSIHNINKERYLKYNSILKDSLQPKREKFTYTSFDNLKLSALMTHTNLDHSKGTIILIHSSGTNKYRFLNLSEWLSKRGYNSVAIDLRAYGESEGKFFTYGVKEKRDIQNLIDKLSTKKNIGPIGVWGSSIGGAVAMQAMGIDKRIKFGIIESTYSDYKTHMGNYFTHVTKLKLKPVSNYIVNRSGKIGDFDINEASPIKYSKLITQPIVIAHGGEDILIDLKFPKANLAAVKSEDKKLIVIDSAGHDQVFEIGGEKYLNEIIKFVNTNNIQLNN